MLEALISAMPLLGQQQHLLDQWLADQAALRGLSVEELAERYTLETMPMELTHDEATSTFRATQTYRLRLREGVTS